MQLMDHMHNLNVYASFNIVEQNHQPLRIDDNAGNCGISKQERTHLRPGKTSGTPEHGAGNQNS
jgi:hypothetical protein